MDAVEQRLNAIETEMRRIADSLGLLIRLDERVIAVMQKQDDIEGRVRAVETQIGSNTYSLSAWQKFGWVILAALAAFAMNVGRDALNKPAVPPILAPQSKAGEPGSSVPHDGQ